MAESKGQSGNDSWAQAPWETFWAVGNVAIGLRWGADWGGTETVTKSYPWPQELWDSLKETDPTQPYIRYNDMWQRF